MFQPLFYYPLERCDDHLVVRRVDHHVGETSLATWVRISSWVIPVCMK